MSTQEVTKAMGEAGVQGVRDSGAHMQQARPDKAESASQAMSLFVLVLVIVLLNSESLRLFLSLSQSHSTERMCPGLSPSIKLPWGHVVAETTVRNTETGHLCGVRGVSGVMVWACSGKAETELIPLGSLSPANCPGGL